MSRPSSCRAQPRSVWACGALGFERDDPLAAGDGGRVVFVGGMGIARYCHISASSGASSTARRKQENASASLPSCCKARPRLAWIRASPRSGDSRRASA